MPERHHVSDLDQAAVTSFLKAIGFAGPNDLSRATRISFHTVAKWYRTDAAEMSAVDFLRIVASKDAQDALASWLKNYRGQLMVAETPIAPPLPQTAMMPVLLGEKSDKKKRRPRR